MFSSATAWLSGTPGKSEVPVFRLAIGSWKSTICPRVLRASGLPDVSLIPLVMTTAYSVPSWSGGSAMAVVPAGTSTAGCSATTVLTQFVALAAQAPPVGACASCGGSAR